MALTVSVVAEFIWTGFTVAVNDCTTGLPPPLDVTVRVRFLEVESEAASVTVAFTV